MKAFIDPEVIAATITAISVIAVAWINKIDKKTKNKN